MIRKILLVEDDKSSAFLVRSVLQKNGYHVFLAGHGLEALEVLAKQPVDIVVTDVVMPHMDGVDLYDELKKRPETRHLPVIIITDKQLFMDAFSALGVEHFVPKAEDINLLLERIKTINADLQKKDYRKVLISGTHPLVIEQMGHLLGPRKYLISTADNSLDTIHKAFLMSPHIALLDLGMDDYAQTVEVVKAIRCFHLFHKMQIITYAYMSSQEMENADAHWKIVEEKAAECARIGGAKFIGNFTQGSFMDRIREFLT